MVDHFKRPPGMILVRRNMNFQVCQVFVRQTETGLKSLCQPAKKLRHEEFDSDSYRRHRFDEAALARNCAAELDIVNCFGQQLSLIYLFLCRPQTSCKLFQK